MQTPHFAATRRDGCRDTVSEAWGAGAAAIVPRFIMSLAAACVPSRSTLRESESGVPFRAVCFVARLAKGSGPWLRLASRVRSRTVAPRNVRRGASAAPPPGRTTEAPPAAALSRKAAVATAWDLIRGSLSCCPQLPGKRFDMFDDSLRPIQS